MEIEELEKKFDVAMRKWDVAYMENNGKDSPHERALSREAFSHYHRWQMALNEQKWLKSEAEKVTAIEMPMKRRIGHTRSKEMDEFWKEYENVENH